MTKKNTTSSSSSESKEETVGFQCPICMESFKTNDGKVVTKCSHTFCLDCFMKNSLRSTKCPMCREIVSDNKMELPSFRHDEAAHVLQTNFWDYFWRVNNVVRMNIEDANILNDAIAECVWEIGVDVALDTSRWYREHF